MCSRNTLFICDPLPPFRSNERVEEGNYKCPHLINGGQFGGFSGLLNGSWPVTMRGIRNIALEGSLINGVQPQDNRSYKSTGDARIRSHFTGKMFTGEDRKMFFWTHTLRKPQPTTGQSNRRNCIINKLPIHLSHNYLCMPTKITQPVSQLC